jgi:hypothetical protein
MESELEELMKLKRSKLDEMASAKGVSDPANLPNKTEVAKAIIMLNDIAGEEPSVEITTSFEAPAEIVDDGLVEVIVTCSQYGLNGVRYRRGDKIRVPKDIASRTPQLSIPLSPMAQDEIAALKQKIIELERGMK